MWFSWGLHWMVLLDFSALAGWNTDYLSLQLQRCLVLCFLVLLSLSCGASFSNQPKIQGDLCRFLGCSCSPPHTPPPSNFSSIFSGIVPGNYSNLFSQNSHLCLFYLEKSPCSVWVYSLIFSQEAASGQCLGNYMAHLIHFLYFVDHSLVLSVVKCLKPTTLYKLTEIFSCLVVYDKRSVLVAVNPHGQVRKSPWSAWNKTKNLGDFSI